MRIVFMGSGSFACPILRAVRGSSADELVGVVTQPDRPQGRNRKIAACPVKTILAGTDIPVLTPEKIGTALHELQKLATDLIVVADYGQYIPSSIVVLPMHRSINVHPSLLPRYRGAAPIQWAIANGDTMTGVTVQYVAKKMDSGDILLQQEFEIRDDDTSETLEPRLADAGAALALRAIDLIRSGHVHASSQDETHATYARKLAKEDGRIDWSQPAKAIQNRIRGFQPWPGAFCPTRQGLLKVSRALAIDGKGTPGQILSVDSSGPLIATGHGALRLLDVQPEGRNVMRGADYMRGTQVKPGEML